MAAKAPVKKGVEGRLELRVILAVVAVLAFSSVFLVLRGSRGPARLATRAVALAAQYHVSLIPTDGRRLAIRYADSGRNHHVWVDLLPAGRFLPPSQGRNTFTVLDYDQKDGVTYVYKPGPWEAALLQAYKNAR